MSLPYKLDPEMAKVLRFENDTLEEEEYSIDDILESAGILTKEQAEELLKEVETSREEWD